MESGARDGSGGARLTGWADFFFFWTSYDPQSRRSTTALLPSSSEETGRKWSQLGALCSCASE